MPAFGLLALAFALTQVLFGAFVRAEARQYDARAPLLAGVAAVALGIAAALALGAILEVLVAEVLLVLLVQFLRRRSGRPSAS
jgi:hypothetical protein